MSIISILISLVILHILSRFSGKLVDMAILKFKKWKGERKNGGNDRSIQ